MKKLHFLAAALLFSGSTIAQNLPLDFESGGIGADWTWTTFENDDNPALEVVANPASSGINTSATVGKFTARQTGNPWAGCESEHATDIGSFSLSAENNIIKIMVYKSVISDVGIKLVQPGNGALPEIKVPNTVINEWEELTFDFTAQIGDPANPTVYDQIVIFMDFNARTAETIGYFDNIILSEGATLDEPQVAAPDPTVPEADVISLFSGVYTDITVDTWLTPWSVGILTDLDIAGNATKKYSALDYVGIEANGDNSIDASDMNYINMHVWTPNSTTYRVKLVDYGTDNANGGGDDVEHEIVIENPTQNEWVEKNIALADFTNLTTKSNISQIILSSLPAGQSVLYVDNVYFSKTMVNSVSVPSFNKFSIYPNPATSTLNLDIDAATATISNYSLVNIQGQVVLSNDVNSTSINTSIDVSNVSNGVYFLKLDSDKGSYTHRVIVQ